MTAPFAPPTLDDWLASHDDELLAFRRHVHAHPELSGQEHETTASVARRLADADLESRVLPTGSGLACDLVGSPGRLIALRADLDALAVDDDTGTPYRSTRPGVAHACGHDVHTTILLGAGLALADLVGGDLAGAVRLLFQPAEEAMPGGALDVIAAGEMDGVDAVYGLHCDPRVDVGRVGLREGAITSAADRLVVTLHGPGGHTARPDRTADLVRLAARIVAELPGAVAAEMGGPVHIVFGALQAGDAANVIPSRAELRGTVRTPDPRVWAEVEAATGRILGSIVGDGPATFEVAYTHGHPPVVNDPATTAVMEDAARAQLGPDAVVPADQSVGGDDFSWYLEHSPGCYARLGVRDPAGRGEPADLHAGRFDVDERCIAVGVRLMVETALRALG